MIVPPKLTQQVEVRPFDLIKGNEVHKGEGQFVSDLLTAKLRRLETELRAELQPPDASAGSGPPAGQTRAPDRVVARLLRPVGAAPASFVGSSGLPAGGAVSVTALKIDVLGMLNAIRNATHRGPAIQGSAIINDKGSVQ